MLLTTPLIHAARERWPAATIDVLGFGGTLGMLRGNTDIAELIEVPAGSGWLASRALIRRLWRRYDLALIAQYSDRAHLYGFAAAKRRAGQVTDELKSWWKRALLEHCVPMNDTQSHSVVQKLRLLEPWVEPHGARWSHRRRASCRRSSQRCWCHRTPCCRRRPPSPTSSGRSSTGASSSTRCSRAVCRSC